MRRASVARIARYRPSAERALERSRPLWLNGRVMPETLHTNAYGTVTVDPDARIVRFTRTGVPWSGIREIEGYITVMMSAYRSRPGYALLLDMREAALRNDPAFEAAAEELGKVTRRFRRVAVLVRTAVGALQAQRMQKQRGAGGRVFDDEAKALEYLRGTDVA
jgi:hypothetical protein